MIHVEIRYIALIASDAQGARIAFPHQNHGLKIALNGEQIPAGQRIEIAVTRRGQRQYDAVTGLPMPEGAFSIKEVTGCVDCALPPTDALLSPGGAQSVLRVSGGEFTAKPPTRLGSHANATWDFGGPAQVSQQLTDTVAWSLQPDSTCDYALLIDTSPSRPLKDGDRLLFANDDVEPKYFAPGPGNLVYLTEVLHLYNLLAPAPTIQPVPTTQYVGQLPPWTAGSPPPMIPGFGPDHPLCPVGQL